MTFAIFVAGLVGFIVTLLTAMSGNTLNSRGTVVLFSSLFGLAYSAATFFGFSWGETTND